jgi:hypothetical protein
MFVEVMPTLFEVTQLEVGGSALDAAQTIVGTELGRYGDPSFGVDMNAVLAEGGRD